MVRDLPLQLVTVKDDEDLYLALLQAWQRAAASVLWLSAGALWCSSAVHLRPA
jgi:hypothetical protein